MTWPPLREHPAQSQCGVPPPGGRSPAVDGTA